MATAIDTTNRTISGQQLNKLRQDFLHVYAEDIKQRLRELGAVRYDLVLPETKYLQAVIKPDETILGVVFGRYVRSTSSTVGRGVLVATDQRLLLIDRKPLFTNVDEFAYDAVGGVKYAHAVLAGTVTVHVVGGDIKLRTFNDKCARIFTGAVEGQLRMVK